MDNAFLFETEKIEEQEFQNFPKDSLSYTYFIANKRYYLFLFQQESINLNFLYQSKSIQLIQQLNSRQRQIRSMRGFILYCLEIMEDDKAKILETNLQPFFWQDARRIINQNKRKGLEKFLFENKTTQKNNKINKLGNNSKIFKSLGKLSDDEKKDIIKEGFQLQEHHLITLKDYYEGENDKSLFKSRGYKIKYESIRRSKIYKEINNQ